MSIESVIRNAIQNVKPEIGPLVDLARAQAVTITELEDAGKKIVEGFELGVFNRSIAQDHEPGWAMKILPYIKALSVFAAKLQKDREAS